MFNYISLDNIAGINKPIKLDFKATPKKREKKDTIYSVEKGVSFNKITGIIGGNASGKTSIIKAICGVGSFINYRSQSSINFKTLISDDIKIVKDIYDVMPLLNDNSNGNMAKIEMDIFIPNGKKPGYYTYYLRYVLDKEAETKVYEKLEYRKKFLSQKDVIFDIKQARLESELGYKYNYQETILEDYKKTDEKLYNNLLKNLEYYETFYKYYIEMSESCADGIMLYPIQNLMLKKWINEDESMVNRVIKIVDKKIDKVTLEQDKDTKQDEVVIYYMNNKKMTYNELSTGTRKILYLIYKSLNTIKNEGILICDEIENSLHLDLVKLMLKLFSSQNSHAQIIFTTNNENVMDEQIMRNDQIYCIARNKDNEIEINKFSDLENTRYDSVFKINYRKKEIYSEQPNTNDINDFLIQINEKNL